jgi:preprotein translocase subunit SecE
MRINHEFSSKLLHYFFRVLAFFAIFIFYENFKSNTALMSIFFIALDGSFGGF